MDLLLVKNLADCTLHSDDGFCKNFIRTYGHTTQTEVTIFVDTGNYLIVYRDRFGLLHNQHGPAKSKYDRTGKMIHCGYYLHGRYVHKGELSEFRSTKNT